MFFTSRGRLNRKPYILRGVLLGVIMMVLNMVGGVMVESDSTGVVVIGFLLCLMVLVLCVPAVMLQIRRWHDLGKSGWLVLLALIPLVNIGVSIYLWVAKGTEGPNQYGEDPLSYGK